ncbi:MAG: hypothetical protein ACI8VC_000904 [Candidatus Endobugula sp.]|jgi:hypothetical protein
MSDDKKPLTWWLRNLQVMPHDTWLWISKSENYLSLNTACLSISGAVEISDEEYEAKESDLVSQGLVCFFCKEQIESIKNNLSQQVINYSKTQFIEAINYYWKNDAFITIKNL